MLIKLQMSQEVRHKIVQKQLKVTQKIHTLIGKYQTKDTYLQKKGSQLLMI